MFDSAQACEMRVAACSLQLLRMHLLENVRVRVEAGHIDYVNELR